jgi:hypothetical protein
LPILSRIDGTGTVLLAAAVSGVAGWFLTMRPPRDWLPRLPSSGRALLVFRSLILGYISLYLFLLSAKPDILSQQLSPYKALSILRQTLDARHALTVWDAKARVDVVEGSTIHVMPGLSLLSPVGPPRQFGLTLDGDNLMPLTGLSPDSEEARSLSNYLPGRIAYQLRPGGRTLVIEAGTGTDVLFALAAGANQVTAVEDNRLIIETIQGPYREFTHGLYDDPRVTTINQSGRVFVRQPRQGLFDVVTISLTDPHRPVTSGAYSLC